jgi:hypothetical protein
MTLLSASAMTNWLQRWFPSRSSYVSPEWLDALANRGSTEGWTEAPRIDWRVNTYTGPRTRQDAPQGTIRIRLDV